MIKIVEKYPKARRDSNRYDVRDSETQDNLSIGWLYHQIDAQVYRLLIVIALNCYPADKQIKQT